MKYGVATLSVVPMRKEPREQSEMISQVLFGEHFEILDYEGSWIKIRLAFDAYIGWIDQKLSAPLSTRYYNYLNSKNAFVLADFVKEISSKEFGKQFLSAGSSLPNYKMKLAFRIAPVSYRLHGRPDLIEPDTFRTEVIRLAKTFLNVPYLWGGRSSFGLDCSGFVQLVYKILGIPLPRDAKDQVKLGRTENFINEAKPGDLVFFDNEEGRIIHVGLLLDAGRIIHASGKVRIDLIDHAGICNIDTGKYTHSLRVIKNIYDYPTIGRTQDEVQRLVFPG